MSNECLNCNSEIKKQNKFCSKSCSAIYNNQKRGNRSELTKSKISQTLKDRGIHPTAKFGINNPSYKHGRFIKKLKSCMNCGEQTYNLCCSKPCSNAWASKRMTAYLKIPSNRKKYKGRSEPSYMEKTFEQWLLSNGVQHGLKGYMKEIHFFNPSSKKHGWADFVFPKWRLIIELDGKQHQKTVYQDMIRDQYLKTRGWKVIRITYKEYDRKTKLELIKYKLGLN